MHRYKDAIDIFTEGLRYFPNAPELYRHRGHRFITLRRLDDAIADLEHGITLAQNRKMEIEADGIPNKLNIPLSNLHFNLYYHLGLAYFLKADYPKAIETYLSCMKYSDNPDLKVATTDWLYLSYLRAGDRSSAEKWLTDINADMEIIENDGYLERLLIYKGEKEPVALTDPTIDPVAFATQNYGISCWYEMNGQPAEAASIRRLILSSSFWPAFGYIAAEADSSRSGAH
jgi:tetratricopeptide (TPR) repeat protein